MSNDQLANSREEDEKEETSQAVKVNIWTDVDLVGKRWSDSAYFIYIENRSPDAAYVPVVYFDYDEFDKKDGATKRKTMVFAVGRFLPACTRIKLPPKMIVDQAYRINPEGKAGGKPIWGGAGINFYDTSGLAWDRFSGDPTDPPRLEKIEKLRKVSKSYGVTWYLEELRQLGAVQKADNCGVD
ncbi:hypothetical protein OG741_28550 [Streptomyces sp. NBC_01410]|uniref:hypothetical protein n=1 Tax=Streptomyces sp. NBC_01410 TaxID=2903856 RepID=UPI00324A38E2